MAAPVTITSSTVAETLFAFNFQLSYLPGYTEFSAAFDQYKIDEVEILVLPSVTTSTTADPVPAWVVMAVDYDDATTPANLSALYEYASCRVFEATKPVSFKLKPRIATAAYSGAFTSYANNPPQWIDIASPSVQHYGLKFGVPATAVAQKWNVFANYHLSFRSPR